MNIIQKIYNSLASIVAIGSFIALRIYKNLNPDFLQISLLILIFLSGFVFIVNNYVFRGQTTNKFWTVLFIMLGFILIIYTSIVLYLFLAFRNIEIGG